MSEQPTLPGMPALPSDILDAKHYLGSRKAALTYEDEFGVLKFDAPTARRLPQEWLELVRWCIVGGPNDGSRQWSRVAEWLLSKSQATTVVSYSDPSVGHDGALYRACGWLWAPTWHRLRPPPSGNGQWTPGQISSVKDRWVYLLREDPTRERRLQLGDKSAFKAMPWAQYVEPKWKRGRPKQGGGGQYWRWLSEKRNCA